MGQKVNPIGFRLGFVKGWESNWYGGRDYGDKLSEDDKIRRYVHARLAKASVSRIFIERTLKLVTVTITTARPGIIIGKGGAMLKKIGSMARRDIELMLGDKVFLETWVKVKKNWRDKTLDLADFGYNEKEY